MPLVHVKTGFSVGYQDFFGYMQTTPVLLKQHKIDDAKKAADQAIKALGIRSSSCHVELMKTEDGWKIIEVGARIGGFRHELYELAYGMDHMLNDLLIRLPKKPIRNKKVRGHATAMKFYPKRKGRLIAVDGINKVRRLESFRSIEVHKKPGDMCNFARNGDDPVFTITLCNPSRSKLLADIRRLETTVKIKIKSPQKTK
jgi:biotin carboxylase